MGTYGTDDIMRAHYFSLAEAPPITMFVIDAYFYFTISIEQLMSEDDGRRSVSNKSRSEPCVVTTITFPVLNDDVFFAIHQTTGSPVFLFISEIYLPKNKLAHSRQTRTSTI